MTLPPLIMLELFARVLFAAMLGGLVGLEREYIARPAGLRTHMLVSVGAALVMVVSAALAADGTGTHDVTRIGAQVVSGIGFLGAGTIIKEGATVKGLTTAASLWVISCVGVAAGAGLYAISAATTVSLLIILRLLNRTETWLKYRSLAYLVQAERRLFSTLAFTNHLEKLGYRIMELRSAGGQSDETVSLYVELQFPRRISRGETRRSEFENDLTGLAGVQNVFDA